MDLPPELAIIHQPVRLQIMGILYKHRDVAFTGLRDQLGLTDGNLASHGGKLQEAGFLDARRALMRDGFEVRYRITAKGSDAFRAYLESLRSFIAGMETLDDATVASQPKPYVTAPNPDA